MISSHACPAHKLPACVTCKRLRLSVAVCCTTGQGYAAAKSLAALAGKVRLAVAGKFPIIPKGYSGLVEQLLAG